MTLIAPFRLKILIELTKVLKSVTPANGYQSDLSDEASGRQRVKRGVLFLGNDDPRTLVSIIEPPLAVEQIRGAPDNTVRANDWDILVQGWAKDDPQHEPCDLAYVLAADVTTAIAKEKSKARTGRPGAPNLLNMQGLVEDIRIGAPVVRPTEDLSDYGAFYILLTMKICEDMAKPFG